MLNRLCQADNVPLVCIVRSEQQAILLRSAGARYVVDSSEPDFQTKLLDAIDQTGATLGYDAIGGGTMASDILHAMDQSQARKSAIFSRYVDHRFIGKSTSMASSILKIAYCGNKYRYAWSVGGG